MGDRLADVFSSRLRAEMRSANIGVSELAKMCGMRYGTIANYADGVCLPRAETVVRIADALDVPIDVLFGRKLYCRIDMLLEYERMRRCQKSLQGNSE